MSKDFPTGWYHATVRDFAKKHFSGPSPTCEERNIQTDKEWGVLKTNAITWSGWDEDAHKVLPPCFWGLKDLQVEAGDVLVTKAGPRHRVGVVAHVPRIRQRLIPSGKMIAIKVDREDCVPQVLAGLLAQEAPQKYLDERTTGMAESQVNFSNRVLLDTPLVVPPIEEQKLIAHILDTLDIQIRRTEEVIAKLEQVKQGLLTDLLTRGIDETGELRSSPEEAPEFYKDSPLGWIPREWDLLDVGDVSDFIGSGLTPRGGSQVYQNHGVLFIRSQNVHFEGLQLDDAVYIPQGTHEEMLRSKVFGGDVLLNITGASIGRVAMVPPSLPEANVNQHVCIIRLADPSPCQSYFLWMLLASSEGQRQIDRFNAGGSREGLNYSQVGSIKIPWPSSSEAQRIQDRFEALNARIQKERRIESKRKAQKAGLMDDLLTGRVRVTPLLEQAEQATG